MKIRELFDPSKDINRRIEMVITYGADQEDRLRSEISEYVVTDNIEEQLRKLLDLMQLAMDSNEENEIGVWVSGFYGSGKSSFTKYLGFALDENVKIGDLRFTRLLQDRLHTAPVKAQLAAVASRFPATVVMLDLASQSMAGVSNADVSTVLYLKVLNWAGYSNNLTVFRFEQMLERDGRFEELESKLAEVAPGMTWSQVQNDPIVINALVPTIANQLYPELFPTPTSFSTKTDEFFQLEDQRVEEMIEIVRRKSGKDYIIFVVDEVGQYVASGDHLILNLDGLAKNLKRIGRGKVWLFSTAQQTLTEDDPRVAINTAKLFKLKDRFPIQIDLESSDIKEICYRRLLGKSPAGEDELNRMFDSSGQQLRHSTALSDASFYDSGFDKENFVNLYPFLPAHFSVLLHLLAALAKSTGGIGLRSAIKVIQDILINSPVGSEEEPMAENPVGWLATAVTLYDALERDIRRAFQPIHLAVTNTCVRYHDSSIHREVAKTIAILQMVGNIPVSTQNVAALMHPVVSSPSRAEEVRAAVEEMLNDPLVPLSDKDGNLGFLSEKLRDIEKERGEIPVRQVELRRIFNDGLRDALDPLPKATLHSTLTITAGVRNHTGGAETSIAGDSNTIQFVAEFRAPAEYETGKEALVNESRAKSSQNYIYLVSRSSEAVENVSMEIYRSQRIAELHRNDPDQEVKDYCAGQQERARKLQIDLKQKLKQLLSEGSFVFRGDATPVSAINADLLEAAKKRLSEVAAQVYDKYSQAPVQVRTDTAEKLLKLGNPSAVTSELDPLGLIQITNGTPGLKTGQAALTSISDYLNQNGQTEGKRLMDHFGAAPFSWSQDTLRYILACMVIVGELKLKVSGAEVTSAGPKAIEALRNNNTFKQIGVALRDDRPKPEMLARAAQRLSEILGTAVMPLEQEISKAASKYFPQLQSRYAPLSQKLESLHVGGADRMRDLNREIASILESDGSDAPSRIGAETAPLYDNLKWAGEVDKAIQNKIDRTISTINEYIHRIQNLPSSGVLGELQLSLSETFDLIKQRLEKDDFYTHAADFNTKLTELKTSVGNAAAEKLEEHKALIRRQADELRFLPDWGDLTHEEQVNSIASVNALEVEAEQNLDGIGKLLNQLTVIVTDVEQIKERIRSQAAEHRRIKAVEFVGSGTVPSIKSRSVSIPGRLTKVEDIEKLIGELQALKATFTEGDEIELQLDNSNAFSQT